MKGFGIPVGDLSVGAGAAVIAVVTGLLATFAGAYWPARRAGRIAPDPRVLGQRETASARHRAARALAGLALVHPGRALRRLAVDEQHVERRAQRALATLLTMAMFVGMVLAGARR
jgi:putative ABC transport system permease protein